jgi:hypothetical protein
MVLVMTDMASRSERPVPPMETELNAKDAKTPAPPDSLSDRDTAGVSIFLVLFAFFAAPPANSIVSLNSICSSRRNQRRNPCLRSKLIFAPEAAITARMAALPGNLSQSANRLHLGGIEILSLTDELCRTFQP